MSWFFGATKSTLGFIGKAREKLSSWLSGDSHDDSSNNPEDDSSDYLDSDTQQESDDDRSHGAILEELPGDLFERDESPEPIDLIHDENKNYISELLGDTPQIEQQNNDEYSPDLLSEFEHDFVITNEIEQLESLFSEEEEEEDFQRLYDEYKLAESLGVSHAELVGSLSEEDIDALLAEMNPPHDDTELQADLSDTPTMPESDMAALRNELVNQLAHDLFLNDNEVEILSDLDDESLIYISTIKISDYDNEGINNPNFAVIKTDNFENLIKAVRKILNRAQYGYKPTNGFFLIDQFSGEYQFYYQI